MKPALFEEGEWVSVVCPGKEAERAKILSVIYDTHRVSIIDGSSDDCWCYYFDYDLLAFGEKWLRKLPPEATDEDFERFMDKLNLPHLVPETV